MSDTTGIRSNQIKVSDKHGTDTFVQMSDGTGVAGNLPKLTTDGSLTDNGICYSAATDTGAANAYAVTLTPTPTLALGSTVVFQAAHANTGASTLAVSGGSAVAIKKESTTGLVDLDAGDFQAGQIVVVVYDATNANWQWVSGGAGEGGPYHIVFYMPGPLVTDSNAQPVMQWTCPSDLPGGVSFANNFGGNARGFLQANPTGTAICGIYYVPAGSAAGTVGTNIGYIYIYAAGTFNFTFFARTFMPGDTLTVWPPSTTDATLSGVGWTLPGARGSFTGGGAVVSATHYEVLLDASSNPVLTASGDWIYTTVPN